MPFYNEEQIQQMEQSRQSTDLDYGIVDGMGAAAAGDAGGALGAAYAAYYIKQQNRRIINNKPDSMKGSFLGPAFSEKDIIKTINNHLASYKYYNDFNELVDFITDKLTQSKVIGWFQGRMEYGPRALGNRSILGDPRDPGMQKKLNLKIKQREGFRPFAPSVLEEEMKSFFDINIPSPYMLFVIPVKEDKRNKIPEDYYQRDLLNRLYIERSEIPAITHIDYSARIQTVNKDTNPKYWTLINKFKEKTGIGIIINTSFNVRGEPIVCTPDDAYRCFIHTEMDYLVIGNYLFDKAKQDKEKISVPERKFDLD